MLVNNVGMLEAEEPIKVVLILVGHALDILNYIDSFHLCFNFQVSTTTKAGAFISIIV
jgi:hypothetical protein